MPHTDGLLMRSGLQVNSANLVLTRNGKGDWSFNRTAAGAETYYLRTTLGDILRTGEHYDLGLFPTGGSAPQTYWPKAPAKGINILDVFAVLNIGVAALTSATLRVGTSVYPLSTAAAAAIVQTDVLAATAIATAVNGAGTYLTGLVALPQTNPPAFFTADMDLVEIELAIVMANTGTVQVAGVGAHVSFNYD
jgi:hypothetical protein